MQRKDLCSVEKYLVVVQIDEKNTTGLVNVKRLSLLQSRVIRIKLSLLSLASLLSWASLALLFFSVSLVSWFFYLP